MASQTGAADHAGTVVVTGGSGFIGRHLARAHLERGWRVRVVDRRPSSLPGCEHVTGDLALDDLAEAFQADVVYHLAGRPGVSSEDPHAELMRVRDNVIATENVASWTPLDVPLVFASSSSVYGGSDGTPCREDGPLAPRGGYAWSKLAAERACAARAREGGLVQIARLFTVLGEGQRGDMALAKWARAIEAGHPVRVFGDLDRSRDFTDVRDVVDVLMKLPSFPAHRVVNVGTGAGQTVGNLISAIGEAVSCQARVELVPSPVVDPYATLADTTTLELVAGTRLRTDLVDVAHRYVGSMRHSRHPRPATDAG